MIDAYLKKLLGEREEVLLVTRRHWFVLLREILVELAFMAFTFVIVSILIASSAGNPLVGLGYLLVLIPLASLIRDALYWSHHMYIVTNLRVIQIIGVFNKNVTDSSLEKVNDVKLEQFWLGRMFNYGNIEVLTASELGVNRFTMIGNPIRFKNVMLNAKIRLDEGQVRSVVASVAAPNNITNLLASLGELRERGVLTDEEFNAKKAKLLSEL